MLRAGPSDLLHLVGFLTGAVLYGMLLVMVARPSARPDPLALATGVLGVVWSVGELGASATRLAGFAAISPWVHALSFTALGLRLQWSCIPSRARPSGPRRVIVIRLKRMGVPSASEMRIARFLGDGVFHI